MERRLPQLVLLSILLIAVSVIVFSPVRHHPFSSLDDDLYVTENYQVKQGLTAGGVRWAFTELYAGFWHPLTWLSHMLDIEIFGPDNPGGHHMSNVVLHATTALALFLALNGMTGAPWRSFFVAALFALHPLHVEPVVWVAERKEVLAGLFWMLVLLLYPYYVRKKTVLSYIVVLIAYTMGLMAKPMLVTMPLILLLLDYWPLRRFQGDEKKDPARLLPLQKLRKFFLSKEFIEKIPFFLIALAVGLLTVQAEHTMGAVKSADAYPLTVRIANAVVASAVYLRETLLPFKLAVFYPHPGMRPLWQIAMAAAVLAAITIWAVLTRKRHPYLAMGWFWYLIALLPVSGLVQIGEHAMADRYTYIPLVGVFIAVTWLVSDFFSVRKKAKAVLPVVAGIVLIACVVLTTAQIRRWKDDVTLFRYAISVTKNNHLAHSKLGAALAKLGKNDEAVMQYEVAICLRPDYAAARNNYGLLLTRMGKPSEALAQYREILKQNPNFAETHNNLGLILAGRGKFSEARKHYEKAVEIDPDFHEAYNNLGILLARSGKTDEAIAQFKKALALRPDFENANNNIGIAYLNKGDANLALEHFQAARRSNPASPYAYNNIGNALLKQGKLEAAEEQYRKALERKADFTPARYNLVRVYHTMGKRDAALKELSVLKAQAPEMAGQLEKEFFE